MKLLLELYDNWIQWQLKLWIAYMDWLAFCRKIIDSDYWLADEWDT